MIVYLSGPMSGIAEHNFPAFFYAEEELIKVGHSVINPANLEEPTNAASMTKDELWIAYMKRDIIEMLAKGCQCIVVLEGWQRSKGATLEVHIAKTLGMKVLEFPSMQEPHESILDEAQRLVHGNRGEDYGHPIKDFSKTALMLTGLFHDKLKDPANDPIRPQDIPLVMICVKMSREMNCHKRDNLVDGVGYFETCDMVHQKLKEQND